ncbi:MAG: fibronectin type III domain-containing protein [Lachnospiraceae bacterium]|nr:fibronectin type III domain-containing protein [Lachnospiraceae bacterium]
MKKYFSCRNLLLIIALCLLFSCSVYADENTTNPYVAYTIADLSDKQTLPYNKTISAYQNSNQYTAHYYKFVVPSAGLVTLHCNSKISPQWLCLKEADKNYWLYDGQSISLGSNDTTNRFRLLPGTYYFCFQTNGYGSFMGDYSFWIEFASVNQTFTYDNSSTALAASLPAIPFNTTIISQLSSNELVEYFKVAVTQKTQFSLHTNTINPSFNFSVLDKDSCYLSGLQTINISNCDTSTSFSLNPGTYYLRFSTYDYSRYTGPYSFSLNVVQKNGTNTNSSRNTTRSLTVQKPYRISVKAGKRCLTVKAQKSGTISGYEIRYRQIGKKWKVINVTGNKSLNRKMKHLKRHKKYQIQVRTYLRSGNRKIYSPWSVTKSSKVK